MAESSENTARRRTPRADSSSRSSQVAYDRPLRKWTSTETIINGSEEHGRVLGRPRGRGGHGGREYEIRIRGGSGSGFGRRGLGRGGFGSKRINREEAESGEGRGFSSGNRGRGIGSITGRGGGFVRGERGRGIGERGRGIRERRRGIGERGRGIGERDNGCGSAASHATDSTRAKSINYFKLKKWAESEDAGSLVLWMSTEHQQLNDWLAQQSVKEDWLLLLVKATEFALSAQHQNEASKQLLNVLCTSRFLDTHIGDYVTEKSVAPSRWSNCKEFVTAVCGIMDAILVKLPQFALKVRKTSSLLFSEVQNHPDIAADQELLTNLTELPQKAGRAHEAHQASIAKEAERKYKQSSGSSSPPPDDYRQLSVAPTALDISDSAHPFVRAAVIDGAYEDQHHYLDVQFRLLREDFVQPLRLEIQEYRQNGNKEKLKSTDLRFYFGVKIVDMVPCHGIVHVIQFDISKFKRINWERSKRFMDGALLCLSKDDFATPLFATVVRSRSSPISDLSKGILLVKFVSREDIAFTSTINDDFVMAETTSYYVSYCHVLEGLQCLACDLPFQEYLIKCKKTIKPPQYLLKVKDDELLKYDLSPLLSDVKVRKFEVPALNLSKWPDASDMCLNQSQKEAAQQALTKELAVIQGPPGTGKTYVGLKVMEVLIKNQETRMNRETGPSDPILLVCYTNHALEQFLLGILPFCDTDIVRIGGKTQSKELEKFNLKPLKEQLRKSKLHDNVSARNAWKNCRDDLNSLEDELKTHSDKIQKLSCDVVSAKKLRDFILDEHFHSLCQTERDPIRLWLKAPKQMKEDELTRSIKTHLTGLVLTQKKHENRSRKSPDIVKRSQTYNQWLQKVMRYYETKINTLGNRLKYGQFNYMSELHTARAEFQSIKDNAAVCILDDKFFNLVLSGKERSILGNTNSTCSNLIERWVLGLYRRPEELLNDIQDLQNYNSVEETSEDLSSMTEGQTSLNGQQIIEDDEDDNLTRDQILNIKSGFASILYRCELLGVFPSTKDEDDGFTLVEKKITYSKLRKKLGAAVPMSEDKEAQVTDVWALNPEERFSLYALWIQRYKDRLLQTVHKISSEHELKMKQNEEIKREEDLFLLRKAKVIALTTTGAAKHRAILQAVGCRIVVVEEAAEVLESHIVTSLSQKCEHLILIGDHLQLRPNPAVYKLAKDFGLDISLFERLVKNGVPHKTLLQQHRMRPEISKILRHIYPDLKDHSSVLGYENIKGVAKNIYFVDHTHKEDNVEDSFSKVNKHESEYLVRLCQYLLFQGYKDSQITILATYVGQMFDIKQQMAKVDFQGQVRVTTVDNFQGEENDIILLSLVRSNDQDRAGFLTIENRICVALSRAKKGFFVTGNFQLLTSRSRLWTKIITTLKEDQSIGSSLPLVCQNHPDHKVHAETGEDFLKCPEGGCGRPCQFRMKCGHGCPRTCHGYDLLHENIKCLKPCPRSCSEGHRCKKKCFEDCGDCTFKVNKTNTDCGHEYFVPCYKDAKNVVCTQRCSHRLPCEHDCTGVCGKCRMADKHQLCLVNVEYSWPCGHICKVPCYRKPSNFPCPNKCEAMLDCGHRCQGTCGDCNEGTIHIHCKEKCVKPLPCGHRCIALCHEGPCHPCSETCPEACRHNSCSSPKKKMLCLEPCLKCFERCKNSKCEKLCNEFCSTKPSDKKCKKKLKQCGHNCSGIEGELCVCGICEKSKIFTVSVPNSSDISNEKLKSPTHQRLLKLPSCFDIFPVTELDTYVNQFDPDGSSFLPCPRCQWPIMKCLRYDTVCKERFGKRQKAKKELKENNSKDACFLESDWDLSLKQLEVTFKMLKVTFKMFLHHINKDWSRLPFRSSVVAASWAIKYTYVLNDIEVTVLAEKSSRGVQSWVDSLVMDLKKMRSSLEKIRTNISSQQKREISNELCRLLFLACFSRIESYSQQHEESQHAKIPADLFEKLSRLRQDLSQKPTKQSDTKDTEPPKSIRPDKGSAQTDVDETLKYEAAGAAAATAITNPYKCFTMNSQWKQAHETVRQAVQTIEILGQNEIKAKCQLLNTVLERCRQILESKDEQMLCHVVENERIFATPKVKQGVQSSRSRILGFPNATAAKERLNKWKGLLAKRAGNTRNQVYGYSDRVNMGYISGKRDVKEEIIKPKIPIDTTDSSDSDGDMVVETLSRRADSSNSESDMEVNCISLMW